MKMYNSEVYKKLTEYFETQSIKEVARTCSTFAIDLNKFLHFDELDKEMRDGLIRRVSLNMKTIIKIIKNDKHKTMKVIPMPDDAD